jgi:hypothetical protein
VAVGPLKDPPVLEAAVEGLVARPRRRLHPEIPRRVAVVVGALDLVGVPHVAVVGLDAFTWQKVAREAVQKDLDVRPGAGGVGPLHPDEIPLEDVDAELVAERGLSCVLVGTEGVPFLGDSLLLDSEVGSVDCHETIVKLVFDETALEVNLWFRERATTMRGGGENNFRDGTTSKKHLPLRPQGC